MQDGDIVQHGWEMLMHYTAGKGCRDNFGINGESTGVIFLTAWENKYLLHHGQVRTSYWVKHLKFDMKTS